MEGRQRGKMLRGVYRGEKCGGAGLNTLDGANIAEAFSAENMKLGEVS